MHDPLLERVRKERCREFVELVASLNLPGEPDNSGQPFHPTDEDNAETVISLVQTARELLIQLDQA